MQRYTPNVPISDSEQNLLAPRETAERLCISLRTLWSLTKSGQLPCVRIGRCVRYAPADLQAFIECQKGGAE